MATHFSVLAWRIPGTVGPSGLPSMGSHRVGHDHFDNWVEIESLECDFSVDSQNVAGRRVGV